MMKDTEAKQLVVNTFTHAFSEDQFTRFVRNFLKGIETFSTRTVTGAQIPQGFRDHVHSYTRLGTYHDPRGDVLDVVVVKLKSQGSLDRARTRQRNLMAHYLNKRSKDAVLVAYVTDDPADWRFSYVKLAFQTEVTDKGKVKVKQEFTPARRYSFLVGENEPNHTAQKQLGDLLTQEGKLTLEQIEKAFNIESVTKEFFEDYKALFLQIKENMDQIVVEDKKVTAEFERCEIDTTNFAKKLLGQIVFLYFLQKKGWLGVAKSDAWGLGDRKFLHNLFLANGEKNFFDGILEPFFYEALAIERKGDYYRALECKVPFLNGGLFEPINGYDWDNTNINLDNHVFEEVFRVFNLYNFTVKEDEPLEKEVAVDPEMLGKVFENLLEVKDRKGKGAFYTPREIVHYMCQESLINYLDTALNTENKLVVKEDIDDFIREGDLSIERDQAREEGKLKDDEYGLPGSIREHAKAIDYALADVKICDPAIGSGAFPVGMMTEIVRARCVLTSYLSNQDNRDPYTFKWHCIENSLYGVDIDSGAVEIAKLRLWLSLVVDEENYDEIRPLPNLDYRIVCGNSLLSVQKNLFNYTLYPELEKKKVQYFSTTSPKNKEVLRMEIEGIIDQLTDGKRLFDFNVYFSEVFSAKQGFDIIIANPPYIRQENIKYLKERLKDYRVYKGTADILVYFYELGINLLQNGGSLGFITSNKFMKAGYGSKLRSFITSETIIKTILDFGDLPVFEATAYPAIVILKKERAHKDSTFLGIRIKTINELNALEKTIKNKSIKIMQNQLRDKAWVVEDKGNYQLLAKIESSATPLDRFIGKKFYRGITTGLNKAFVITDEERQSIIDEDPNCSDLIKPFLRGRDIKRYLISKQGLYLIYIPNGWTRKNRKGIDPEAYFKRSYPAIFKRLKKYQQDLQKRDDKGEYWWEMRPCKFLDDFEKKKIVYPDIAKQCEFAFDVNGQYLGNTSYMIPTDKLFLLGILNSSVIEYWYRKKSAQIRGGFLRFIATYMVSLPIPSVTNGDEKLLENNVIQILDMKSNGLIATKIEHEIDQLVFQLYNLTEEEIAIVEESVGK